MLSELYSLENINDWIVCEDFNIFTNVDEKQGDNPIELGITNKFNDTIASCNLKDIGYTAQPFT